MTPEEIQKALKELRSWSRFTYDDMGRLFQVHRTTVNQIISGRRKPSPDLQARIEKNLKKLPIFDNF